MVLPKQADTQFKYEETRHFNIYHKTDLHFDGIPVDASKKMNDHMMDLLTLFDLWDTEPFKASERPDWKSCWQSTYQPKPDDYPVYKIISS